MSSFSSPSYDILSIIRKKHFSHHRKFRYVWKKLLWKSLKFSSCNNIGRESRQKYLIKRTYVCIYLNHLHLYWLFVNDFDLSWKSLLFLILFNYLSCFHVLCFVNEFRILVVHNKDVWIQICWYILFFNYWIS